MLLISPLIAASIGWVWVWTGLVYITIIVCIPSIILSLYTVYEYFKEKEGENQ